jgi:hypothetical protein
MRSLDYLVKVLVLYREIKTVTPIYCNIIKNLKYAINLSFMTKYILCNKLSQRLLVMSKYFLRTLSKLIFYSRQSHKTEIVFSAYGLRTFYTFLKCTSISLYVSTLMDLSKTRSSVVQHEFLYSSLLVFFKDDMMPFFL